MPSADLDVRLWPTDQPLGGAFVGLKLGVLDAFSLARMSGPRDQFGPGGRLREASKLVAALLAAGGRAVVLHKAAAVVKPAPRFLAELRDTTNPELRPWAAWLDVIASHDGSANECRTFGMPHFFGAPNVRAVLPAAPQDAFALERAMQATKYAAGLLTNAEGALPATLQVPVGWYPGPRAPRPVPGTAIPWQTQVSADGLTVDLRCPDFVEHHLATRWDANPAAVPHDLYARGLEEALMRSFAPELSMNDVIGFNPPPGQPPLSLLVFERADGLTVFVTAGFGRVRAASGTVEQATEYAEFCIAVPRDEPRFHRPLLTLGSLALTTPVQGGLKDFDGLPPGSDGVGFVVMPLEDVPLGRRPLALRQFVPVTAEEYGAFRTLDGPGRKGWLASRIRGWSDSAARWR
jgi:hypothetical protein